jgi:hypothetical protein
MAAFYSSSAASGSSGILGLPAMLAARGVE